MVAMMRWAIVGVLAAAGAAMAQDGPAGSRGVYALLTAEWHVPGPFAEVLLTYGPKEADGAWWELQIRKEHGGELLMALRALTDRDPAAADGPGTFHRYILRIPATQEVLEYRDVHTGKALLPAWKDFEKWFIPRAGRGTLREKGVPHTLSLLGHTLTLIRTEQGRSWEPWEAVKRLDLDRELLVGTGRSFRDAELKRLPQTPQRQNYTYVQFVKDEYPVMIEAGINLFVVSPKQAEWVRAEPVFYLMGSATYPADLYRGNYVGPVMFMDEPAIILIGDKLIHNTLRHFSDATTLLMQRVKSRYNSGSNYSAFQLETQLKKAGVNLGAMRLEQWDYPAWETIYETAYYQLAAGLAGIVHEGRYQLDAFDKSIAPWLDKPRKHTPDEMLRYHYAFLRGAARQTGKHWGTAIYGQAEPKYNPLAVRMAYDMGARYVWFWTSDHDHHMPWPEQLELARVLKAHAKQKPRGSIYDQRPVLDTAIVIPFGWWLELGNLWWVRAIDVEHKGEYWRRYERLMRRAHAEIVRAMDRDEDFDILVEDGTEVRGYRRVVRVSDQ